MNTQVLQFIKSEHFLLSQWNRAIDEQSLYRLLRYVKHFNNKKAIAIIFPSFMKKHDVFTNDKKCLVVVTKNNLLVTIYWCDQPDYFFAKPEEKETHFQILY